MGAFVLGLILAASTSTAIAGQAVTAPRAPNIHIYSCQVVSGVLVPQADEIGLAVRFENNSTDALKSIVWRAKYGTTWIDFIDDGTFSPQTRVDNFVVFEAGKRKFNWLGAIADTVALGVGAYPSSPLWNTPTMFGEYVSYNDPDNCSIVRTISSDGGLWVNSAIAAQQPFIFPSPSPTPAASGTPAATSASSDPPPAGNIAVSDCEPGLAGMAALSVRYTNVAPHSAKRITFRVPYKSSGVDFVDAGTFSPDVLIKHNLRATPPEELKPVAYVPFPDSALCQVVSVQYDDGSVWQNPSLGATPPPLPSPLPDAMSAQDLARARWSQLHGFPTPLPSATP